MKIKSLRASNISLAAALLVAAIDSLHGQGTLMFQHFGASDPASEGFAASIAPQAVVGPVTGDQGLDAWFIQGGGPATVFYSRGLSSEERAQLAGTDWTISLTLRLVQSPETYANSFLRFATGSEIFLLAFGSESDGDPFVRTYDANPAYILDGGANKYHDYQLRYNALNATADLWVDGVKRLNDVPSRSSSQSVLEWGVGQGDFTRANWNQVSLSVIPEPSSFALCLCGSLLLASRFWKCKPGQQAPVSRWIVR